MGRGYGSLADAVAAIGGGSGTILIAPGRYRECAVQEADKSPLSRASPEPSCSTASPARARRRWCCAASSARVEGIVFQNLRVADANGAGIRLEDGDLVVRDSLFRNGENGILVANDHDGTIRVEQSTFSGLGSAPRTAAARTPSTIAATGALIVTRSRFERGTGGHYVKSRGARIEVTDSSFDDSGGRATNYMIDLSNGATGTIARNLFVQGADKENYSAFIMVAPEGVEHSSAASP
jgi:hypothetical protein